MTVGTVYLVGAGPGDPGLLTVRGRELIGRADVVVYDRLVNERLLQLAPQAEHIYAGKRAGHHTLTQEEINGLLVERAQAGQNVVRLKGGDPFTFGRGGEEGLALARAGVPFEVVPGITAGIAAAAYAGIPVTHRKVASSVALITGHEAADKDESALDWSALARWEGTLAFYMGIGKLPDICRRLRENGKDPETPGAVVRWGTTPRQLTVTGTLETLPHEVERAGLKPPGLILIGSAVGLRDELSWFEKRPLFGRTVVVTRPREQNESFVHRLEELGAEPVEFPTIRIAPAEDPRPLAEAVREVGSYDWVVLTSTNGVKAFFAALAEAGLDSRALAGVGFCAIGPRTGSQLAAYGIDADLQPPRYTSSALVETLREAADLRGARVLCPRSDAAPPDMIEDLKEQGAEVREVIAYRTVPDAGDVDALAKRLSQGTVDWLTFTSSTTVTNFFAAIPSEEARPGHVRIASIGPVTSATLREAGVEPDVEADPHTVDGLVRAMIQIEQTIEVST